MKGIQNTSTNNFSTIIGNNRKFIVPKFQRDYSWENEQWDDLWQDIVTMRENHEDHYMGYLVLQTEDDKCFQIIDGQQRFTTITVLILAAIKCLKKFIENGEDAAANQLRVSTLMQTYIGKSDPVTLDYDNILVLNRNNDAYFRDYLVKLGDLKIRNLKTTEKLMKRCFEYYERMLDNKYSSGQEYAQFIQDVVENIYFTQIVVTDEMNAFRVFETLNARGVQLSSSDLLKNYLFSLVDHGKSHISYIDSLEQKWVRLTDNIRSEKMSEFLRYYWNTNHRSIRTNAVFKTIRKEISTDEQVFRLIDDMLAYSDIYMALTNEDDELWEDPEIRKLIGLLNLFRLKQPYPVLMAAKRHLTNTEFKKVLQYILKICFRYNVICDRNPNDQDGPFNNLAIFICNNCKVDYSLLSSIMVEDAVFENAFMDKAFPYNSRNAKIVRYILGNIETYKGSSNRIGFDNDDATIEHILPQNPSEDWHIEESQVVRYVYRIGNICLLERRLNRDLQNETFENKKTIYKQSVYAQTRLLAEHYSEWDEKVIAKRQRLMAKDAVVIWKL